MRLFIEWQIEEQKHSFQSEGIVRHTLARIEGGVPVYLSGIELHRVSRAIRTLIRERIHRRLWD